MMIFPIVVPDTYRRFTSGTIADVEALKALNKRINRSDDWWQNEPGAYSISRVNVNLETTLICWDHYIRRSTETSSRLFEKRKLEMPKDESETNHASEVVSSLQPPRISGVWTYVDRIARVMAVMEMIVYTPLGY